MQVVADTDCDLARWLLNPASISSPCTGSDKPLTGMIRVDSKSYVFCGNSGGSLGTFCEMAPIDLDRLPHSLLPESIPMQQCGDAPAQH